MLKLDFIKFINNLIIAYFLKNKEKEEEMVEKAKTKVFFIERKKFKCFLISIRFDIKCIKCGYSNIEERKENKFWRGDIVYENVWKYVFWPIEVAFFCPKCKNLVKRIIE